MGTQDTTITNESEAMEVAEAAYSAGNLTTCDGYYEFDLDAAARVIATALEARDAASYSWELRALAAEAIVAYRDEDIAERDARIAELEGALEVAREKIAGHPFIGVNAAKELLAILTKGNTAQ